MKHSTLLALLFTTPILVSLACNAASLERSALTQVPTSSIYASSISVGGGQACALLNSGHVVCWGDNSSGQLIGDGAYTKHYTATEVVDLTEIVAISAGSGFACAITESGGAKCWGRNDYGQLGNGTPGAAMAPVDIPDLTNVTGISAGGEHACAVTTDGALKCWGMNLYGRVGNGSFTRLIPLPTDVVGLGTTITNVSAGNEHTCALTTKGDIKCWGHNAYGELGSGQDINQSKTPLDVIGVGGEAIAITTGFSKSCAVTRDGEAKCWGWIDLEESSNMPVNLGGLDGKAKSIAAGANHICVVLESGRVRCMGENKKGQLGNGTTTDSQRFVEVKGLPSAATAIGAAYDFTCALTTTGEVFCWGDNSSGQLGNGAVQDSSTPVKVIGINQ